MRCPDWIKSHGWLLALLLAAGFVLWTSNLRMRHTLFATERVGVVEVVPDPTSKTGYADGVRALIAAEHNKDSYQWIAQTQEMLARGEWRLRQVDYDNAPAGREVHTASVYRWWLASVAWFEHLFSGRSMPLAVERAALLADPVLHVIVLIVTAVLVRRWFGPLAAAFTALAWSLMFPLASSYLAGQPDDFGLSVACAFWSVLPIVAALNAPTPMTDDRRDRMRGKFILAGAMGGVGLWINASVQAPLLLGLAAGAAVAATWKRSNSESLPWRAWAIAGATTSLLAYVIEYAPAHLIAPRFEVNHPIHALGWLATGECLAHLVRWRAAEDKRRRIRESILLGASALVLLAVGALALWRAKQGFEFVDLFAGRVTNLPGHVAANNLSAWIARDGFAPRVVATIVPFLGLVVAAWLFLRSRHHPRSQRTLLITAGPVLVAIGFACARLRWWSVAEATLLALLVVMLPIALQLVGRRVHVWALAAVPVFAVPGLISLAPPLNPEARDSLSDLEVLGLIERDLAHWMTRQAGPEGATVLAPPELTASLCFHGGLRGLGSPYSENRDGFAIAVRIAGATTPDEAEALVRRREVTHIVMPSWDRFLDEYARLATGQPESSLIALLHRWLPPRWLRPVAYPLPGIEGFENEYAAIFAITDVQDNATALSRLAEYFVEMGQLEPAQALAHALQESFATDLNATVARAHVAFGSRDAPAFRDALQAITSFLTRGDDEELTWDRRVSLAVALLQANRADLARPQMERCADEADESGLRMLSTAMLFRLLSAWRIFGIEPADPQLFEFGKKLVPIEMREKL